MFIVFVQYLSANQGHNPPSLFLLKNKIEKRKQKKTTCSITQFARNNVQFYPPNIPLYLYGCACDMCANECKIHTRMLSTKQWCTKRLNHLT